MVFLISIAISAEPFSLFVNEKVVIWVCYQETIGLFVRQKGENGI
jgi:hypothetical protein